MSKNILRIILLLFFLFGLTANSMAEQEEDFDRTPTKEQREKVRERIETMRMWKLTKALDLEEKTSAQLFPMLSRYGKKRAEIENSMRENMRSLRMTVKEGRKDNLKGILDKLEQSHKAFQEINNEEIAELKKVLTIEQQAKFILFRQDFDREMKEMIEDARGRRAQRLGKDSPEEHMPPGKP